MATQSSNGASFEGPHGWFHVTVGGDGHMTDVGYSAFDPIFWLHHTNVDRHLAMWQAINPNSDLQQTTEPGGNWWLRPGQTLNRQTALIPFHGSDGKTPYNTEKVKHPKKFGYSYPDVRDWEYTGSDGPSRLASAVTARVNQLYSSRGRSAKRSIRGNTMERAVVPHEWTAAVSAPNDAAGGKAYTVSLFFGEKPDNPKEWPFKSFGGLYVLAQPMASVQGPMTAHTEIILTGQLENAGIDTSNVNASRNYIDKELHWGVQLPDGTVIPNDEFKSFLNITIEDEIVKLPVVETELPKYSDLVVHDDITPVILNKR